MKPAHLIGAIFVGLAAYWLAIGVGIPAWRDWEPGDAADIGFYAGMAALLLSVRRNA